MESNFKVGDKVYSHVTGWVEVLETTDYHIYLSKVHPIDRELANKLFSFTEYTMENFNNDRNSISIGKWAMFWDNLLDTGCIIRKISGFNGNGAWIDSCGTCWLHCEILTDEQIKILNLEE